MIKKNNYISFLLRIEKKELDKVRKIAFKERTSIAEQIRRLIKQYAN